MKVGRFEATRDSAGWTLTETKAGKTRKGEDKEVKKDRHYANLAQCCSAIIDISAQDASTVQEVVDAIKSAEKNILAAIKATP